MIRQIIPIAPIMIPIPSAPYVSRTKILRALSKIMKANNAEHPIQKQTIPIIYLAQGSGWSERYKNTFSTYNTDCHLNIRKISYLLCDFVDDLQNCRGIT